MKKNCQCCGVSFIARRSTAHYCSTACRVRAYRQRKVQSDSACPQLVVLPSTGAPVDDVTVTPNVTWPNIYSTTKSTLKQLDKLDTWQAQQALAIAARLDSPATPASSMPQLSRELDRIMNVLASDASDAQDDLDKLASKVKRIGGR